MWKLVVGSPQMEEVVRLAEAVAATEATVLITGESGTGKELVARFIHQRSRRHGGPFVAINCAAIPEGLLEAELFGHERGAFTGAIRRRRGKLELAHGGTLLLDEVGEMSPKLQAKLLRVLQDHEFERLGGSGPLRVDIRVIATTNRNLRAEVRRGTFREDLYWRLNVFHLHLPPLRERPQDVLLLAKHFLRDYAERWGRQAPELSPQAQQVLLAHRWPGNVRELQNAMERALVLSQNGTIGPEHLLLDGEEDPLEPGISVREMERRLILQTLERVGGNRTRAARLLGITTRTLRNKLKEYKEYQEGENLSHPEDGGCRWDACLEEEAPGMPVCGE